jgi:hypothetical protein
MKAWRAAIKTVLMRSHPIPTNCQGEEHVSKINMVGKAASISNYLMQSMMTEKHE